MIEFTVHSPYNEITAINLNVENLVHFVSNKMDFDPNAHTGSWQNNKCLVCVRFRQRLKCLCTRDDKPVDKEPEISYGKPLEWFQST